MPTLPELPASRTQFPPPIAVVTPYPPTLTETFIRRHIEQLPTRVVHIEGWRPRIGNRTVLPFPRLAYHKLRRMATGNGIDAEITEAYRRAFRRYGVRAVLAEYGEVGAIAADACELEGLPLIVHFHGYDASHREVLNQAREGYRKMFPRAAAIIAVSRSMRAQLVTLGAPPERVYLNPYGADCEQFQGADPAQAGPVMLAVGRFTDKKAPALTLRAFNLVATQLPSARLRMIGDGPQFEESRVLAEQLGIVEKVEFLGARSHDEVSTAMRSARCFVQHSRVAADGDSEGTPVAIIEAQAAGLPVVATRHAGIPDVVVEGQTGFLVAEGDVEGMAGAMLRLATDAELAGKMGAAARRHVLTNFTAAQSLAGLWRIILDCISRNEASAPAGDPNEPARTAEASRPLS